MLLPVERIFMRHVFALDGNGRLVCPETCYGVRKRSGKTTLAALIVLVMVLLRSSGRFSEGYCVANDLDQAVAQARGAHYRADCITFPALHMAHAADRPVAGRAFMRRGGQPS